MVLTTNPVERNLKNKTSNDAQAIKELITLEMY